MKIVVTSAGETLHAEVDPRFGRAQKFILYDTDTGEWSVLDNTQNVNAMQGAGIQAAQSVAECGAEAVLTGNCGPKAFRILSEAGMSVYVGLSGTVLQAIDRFKKGELEPASAANKPGHWM